jgi:hypothetical protein
VTGRRPRKIEVIEADDRSRRALARQQREVSAPSAVFVVVVDPAERDKVADALDQMADALNEGERLRMERLVEALTPAIDVPTPAVLEQARREAVVHTRLLREFGACTAADVAEAEAWRAEGRIFSVSHQGTPWYLGFQFGGDGAPLPAVADVLTQLQHWPEWEIATWFVRENGMLNRRRPVDLLEGHPKSVAAAAAFDADRVDTRSSGPHRRLR